MKVYICGPITGQINPREKFAAAENMLQEKGFTTVNPFDNGLTDEDPWETHLHVDLEMLEACEGIYYLPKWEFSRGCCVENLKARELNLTIVNKLV